jgi:hypothetical protein
VAVVLVAFVASTGVVGFPGPGAARRYPLRDLEALADKTNQICGTRNGRAEVDVLSSRVNYFGGVPADLSEGEAAMLGSGAKVACVRGAIS